MEASDDRIVLQVLRFLGELYDISAEFCRKLRDKYVVAGSLMRAPTHHVGCRAYKAGVVVNIWVEALLQGEDSLTWEMDIRQHSEGWLVDSRVCRVGQGDGGTSTLLQLAGIVEPTFAEIERQVPATLKELFDAGTEILRGELAS